MKPTNTPDIGNALTIGITRQQLAAWNYLQANRTAWRTIQSIADGAGAGISLSMTRHHLKRLLAAGLLDQAIVHPERRYRLSPNSANRAVYQARMTEAAEAFGIKPAETAEKPPVPRLGGGAPCRRPFPTRSGPAWPRSSGSPSLRK